jgi:hypothetical protein
MHMRILVAFMVVVSATTVATQSVVGPDGVTAQTARRTVYVSSSTGSPAHTGLSPASPKRTIEQGYALLRDGHGDKLLLKRGDRFAESIIWSKSGRSRAQPAVLGAYGEGPRPVLEGDTGDRLILTPGYRASQPLRHVAVSDVHFYAKNRDPKRGGIGRVVTKPVAISITGHEVTATHLAEDILIQDVRIEAFGSGINIVGGGASGGTRDVRIRRTQILDTYSTQGHMHGLYASETHGFLFEDGIIDSTQRAELPGVQSKTLDHSIYIQSNATNVTIRGNVLSRGPDGCMQRPGGVFEDNLVIDVEVGSNQGLIWGGTTPVAGGIETVVRRNAFVGLDRGVGLMLGNIRKGEVRDNLFLGKGAGTAMELYGTTRLDNVGVHDLRIENNIAVGVRGLVFHERTFSNIVVRGNVFKATKPLVTHRFFDAKTFRYRNNRYAALGEPNPFRVAEQAWDPQTWATKVGESPRFDRLKAPPRAPGIEQYMRDAGGSDGGLEAFLRGARDDSPAANHTTYSARAVVRYLQGKLSP